MASGGTTTRHEHSYQNQTAHVTPYTWERQPFKQPRPCRRRRPGLQTGQGVRAVRFMLLLATVRSWARRDLVPPQPDTCRSYFASSAAKVPCPPQALASSVGALGSLHVDTGRCHVATVAVNPPWPRLQPLAESKLLVCRSLCV